MAIAKKGLGRGLSALIPDDDMEFLSRVARGDTVLTPPDAVPQRAPAPNAPAPDAPAPDALANGSAMPTDDNMNRSKPAAAKSATSKVSHETPQSQLSASAAMEAAPAPNPAPVASRSQPSDEPLALVEWIETAAIDANPFQPRRTFSPIEMQELEDSVRSHGILQPILVRPVASAVGRRFQLVAGERRWRAACAVGLDTVPAVIRVLADQQALELAVIENVQRHDISAVDAALAYKRLAREFGLSQDSIARRVGKSRSAVANTMRLLDLPAEAQKAIEVGELTEGHGRAILSAPTEGARRAIFRRILRDGLSVRETEAAARRSTDSVGEATATGRNATRPTALGVELQGLESELQKVLGTRLKIKPSGQHDKGGQILIEYFSDQDLQRLLSLFRNSKRAL